MGPNQKEDKRPKLSVKATFWLSIVLLVVVVALMVVLLLDFSYKVAGLFVLLMFVFVFLNKGCWKCPACKKHLGRFGKLKTCPNCGEKLDI